MGKSINQLGLSTRATNALHKLRIHSTQQLQNISLDNLRKLRNVGAKTISELEEVVLFYRGNKQGEDDKSADNTVVDIPSNVVNQPNLYLNNSIDNLHMSNRARNCLHRAGVHSIRDLILTSIDDVSNMRNVGVKTQEEINNVLNSLKDLELLEGPEILPQESTEPIVYSENELMLFSKYSIVELALSVRAYNGLVNEGLTTLDKVIPLQINDLKKIRNLGSKSISEIQEKCKIWLEDNRSIIEGLQKDKVSSLKEYKNLADLLDPIFKILPVQLLRICEDESLNIKDYEDNINNFISLLIDNSVFCESFTAYYLMNSKDGIIGITELHSLIQNDCSFDAELVMRALDEDRLCCTKFKNYYVIKRKRAIDYLDLLETELRKKQIINTRLTKDVTLQVVAEEYGITRERVRQIVQKFVRNLPLCFEDTFEKPFRFFNFNTKDYMSIFGDKDCSGFNYLSVKYKHGHYELSSTNAEKYKGPFCDIILKYINDLEQQQEKMRISKTDLIYRVLLESDSPLSIDSFQSRYDQYLSKNDFNKEKYEINIRTVINHLRTAKNIVFNKNNEVRYLEINAKKLIDKIDFSLYKNLIISSELIFQNNIDLMDSFDVHDGYELFYILKSWKECIPSKHEVQFRRVPTLIFGHGSEKEQVMRLLKELSPIPSADFFKTYEERYGVRMNSAQANLYNYVAPYLVNGIYKIDVKTISKADETNLIKALRKKNIWFIEDIRSTFKRVCTHSSVDAINSAAFLRIGYKLYPAGYAISASYESVFDFFDKELFNKDIINLNDIDMRIQALSMFGSYMERLRSELRFIEVNPRIYMSSKEIEHIFSITKDDIYEIQKLFSKLCTDKYFNGNSIWPDALNQINNSLFDSDQQNTIHSYCEKMKENRWLLTSILKLSPGVYSMRTTDAVILSKESGATNLGDLCSWVVNKEGRMSIKQLQDRIHVIFGANISKHKLVEKIRERHLWDSLVTDQIEDYISNLLKNIDDTDDEEDYFAEEFF